MSGYIKPPLLVQELLLLGLQAQWYYTCKVHLFFIKNRQKVVIMISQSIVQT